MKKRLLSLLLVFVMVLGMLPTVTFAAEEETDSEVETADNILRVDLETSTGSFNFIEFVDADGNAIEGITIATEGEITGGDESTNAKDTCIIDVTLPADYSGTTVTAKFDLTQNSSKIPFVSTQKGYTTSSDRAAAHKVTELTTTLSDSSGTGKVYFYDHTPTKAANNYYTTITFNYTVPAVTATCLSVAEDAVSTASVTTGELYELDLTTVFADSEGHDISYSFETTVENEHTKISDGVFYFSASDEGTYEVTLTATCDSMEVSHTLTVTVEAASEGIEAQYGYDETNQASVTVYVTLSNDGYPIVAADGTVMSHLEVTVPYFDLGLYGLEDYYRYGTDGGSGSYTGTTVIQRPTGLHLYIYLLERYYMGLSEEKCCLGTSGVLEYAEDTGVYFMDGELAYESDGKSALYTSGGATSIYMVNFWGHDENLMYFRNHCYPYMSAGWGATSDYILLSDGDTWDVGMFTNWNFYQSGYFARFDADEYTADAGASVTVSTQKWGTTSAATSFEAVNGLSVGLYDSKWNLIDELDYTSGNSITFTAPTTAGTYYLMALDPNAKDTEEAKIAPATAVLTVEGKNVCDECVDENSDRYCDVCGNFINSVPALAEGVDSTLTVTIQTGLSYQCDDLVSGNIFTDADGDSMSYAVRKSSDGGETWGEWTEFGNTLEHGTVNKALSNSTEGTYTYQFKANDGYGDSEECWTLTLITLDVIPAEVNFYVGRDQNYSTHSTYPILELYKTAGLDENLFDYVGWFTNANGETEYVYNPKNYTIIDGDTDYVVIDGVQYELHDYEKVAFTNSAFDDSDETAMASGTVVDNYNMFYASVTTGRYSTRAYGYNTETEAYDIYLGGQSMELPREVDIYGNGGDDIYLRVVSCYTTSKKVDSTYFAAEDYYVEMIMPITGSMIHAGDPYVSGNYTYYPFLSWAAGNGSLYNIYAYPRDTDNYIFNQSINNTTSAGYTVVTKSLTIGTAIELKVTVPESGEFGLYFQYNNFNTKEVEPAGEAVVNGDGTKTITYKVTKSNSNYTWRLTDPSGTCVTKAGWLASMTAATEKTITFSEKTDKASHDFSELGTAVSTRDEADIQVFLDHDGFLSTSDTYRVRAFRMWQLINSDTANIMVEPDMNIQVLQGSASDVSLVDGGNANGNWIDVTPTGTDIIAVNYDAMDVYSTADNYGTHAGFFPATNPERTGVFVITNEAEGTATAGVSFNGSKTTDRGTEWDYNYDTWYYLDTVEDPTLDFTVSGTGDVSVSYATVITDSSLNSTLSGWTSVSADEDGYYHADMLKFRNASTLGGTVIIKMTDSTGTSYQLVRVAEMTVTVTNASNPGEVIMAGDSVSITFDGLYRSVNKVAGIFNPTTYYLRYTASETEVNGSLAQYQQMDRASITLTIPEDLEFPEGETSVDYSFTNGYIYGSMYSASSPFDTLYNMTDTGVGTNFSAVGVSFVLSRLADIPVTVAEKVYYAVELPVTDGENAVTGYTITLTDSDGNELTASEDGIYQLGYGKYSYSVICSGYVCNSGSFTLGSDSVDELVDGILTKTIVLVKAAENAWDGTTVTEPATDDNGVYQIGTGAELAWFAQTVNSNGTTISAILTADIDLAGYDWTPIGTSSKQFMGSFDGQGYKVYNLAISYAGTTTAVPYRALFGYVGGSTSAYTEIKDLTVEGNITVTSTKSVSNAYSAGVIGYGKYVNITNVHANVDVTAVRVLGNWQYVGGLAGYLAYATVDNCSNSGTVNAWRYSAGLVGGIGSSTTITGCVNTGNVTCSSTCAAGIVADLGTGCTVSCCYNTGSIAAGGNYAAGIVGNCGNATVSNCFNAGTVRDTSGMTQGSVIGYISNASAVTENLYYLEGTCAAGMGSVKDEATQFATAVSAETLASNDFVTTMNTGLETAAFVKGTVHPILTWQASDEETEVAYGDVNDDGSVTMDDVSLVLQYVNGTELTEGQIAAADVNGDGSVNMTDVSLILQYINGVITQFPVES